MIQIRCPSCRALLRLNNPEGVKGPLSCPRCLAPVTIPSTPKPTEKPAAASHKETGIQVHHCPSCHVKVEAESIFCSKCGAILKGPLRQEWEKAEYPDFRIHRDRAAISVGVWLLAILGGGGLAIFSLSALMWASQGWEEPLITLVVVIVFLWFLGLGIAVNRNQGNYEKQDMGRVFGNGLVFGMAIVGGVILVGGAIFLFLFIACVTGLTRI